MHRRIVGRRVPAAAMALLAVLLPCAGTATGAPAGIEARALDEMSTMGRIALEARAALERQGAPLAAPGECCDDPPPWERPDGGQAELSIAVDATGMHVVVGFNDTRGFALNPIRVSGYMYSDDGGRTFTDGGQLPSPGTRTIGTTRYPQVFGDPDIRYLGGCTFVYASILVDVFAPNPSRTVQTMSLHRSTDCGHTWEGPFEVTAATNPNGLVSPAGSPRDAADKEFIDVDPETGRVMMTWSNFTPVAPGGVQIMATYTDDVLATPPTWSPPVAVAQDEVDGQSSIPRFAGRGSAEAYVAWRRFPGAITNTIGFARSTDNGATWSAPIDLSPPFKTMDQVLGNDRVNTSPCMAVDVSPGRHGGTIYVVYANNDLDDGADVVLQKSTDGGRSFSAPRRLNARPGADRAQWFPVVTVDLDTGRVHVFYYDQGIAATGDRTVVSHTWSDDGGATWTRPRPLAPPFHAGWGNDTGQPNLGDYNQAVAQGGEMFAAFGYAGRPPRGFVDGQPSTSLTVPDVVVRRVGTSGPGITGTLDGESPYGSGPLLIAPGDLGALAPGGLRLAPRLGAPSFVPLLAEDFESAPPGTLPAGWIAAHGGGANTVPWAVDDTFCGGTRAAFHANADDGPPGGSPARWERLISPAFAVPADADYVLVTFDVCYDTEDDPAFDVLAYDGFFLRVTDLTPGQTLRSVLAEAFADVFLTGRAEHYPKHLPRSSDPAYFQDMSVWAGDSGGVRRVHMLLPGMAGTTAQLRFEFTQDAFLTCADVRPGRRCGVALDNLAVTAVGFAAP